MSRTATPSNRTPSPVKLYLKWKGAADAGHFEYWDKARKENVELPAEVDIIVCDNRSSVSGWSDANSANIYSNLIRSTTSDVLTVKTKKDGKDVVLVEGLYKEIKPNIVEAGGKFCTNVFCLVLVDGEWVPANMQFSGSSLMEWTGFLAETKVENVYASVVTVSKNPEVKKKGAVKYTVPMFSVRDITEDEKAFADDFDTAELQPWLAQSKAQVE